MRDQDVYNTVKKHVGQLAQQVQGAFGMFQRDVTELQRYISAETIRREVLEEILFEKSALLGGVSKEEFEKRFEVKINKYKEEQDKALEELKAKQKKEKEEADKQSSKPKIYLPGEV